MPAIPAHPPELWNRAKELYLSGKAWKEIAGLTGLTELTLRQKATTHRWTIERREIKAKESAEGETVKTALAKSLVILSEKLNAAKPKSLGAACQIQSMLVPAVQNAKTVFGWGEQQQSSALSVLAISSAEVVSSPGPVLTDSDPVQDAEIVPPADSYEI